MANDNSTNSARLNCVDRHGREIDPKVLAAAETVFQRALNHGMDTLGDSAVVANTLEEIAATVSVHLARRNSSAEAAPIRNLAGYIFRAFSRQLNRLKRKEVALLNSASASETQARSVDPSHQFEMQILLHEYLARFDFEEKDMCWRRLEGHTWDEIGKMYGITGHTAEVRLLNAVRRVKADLAKKRRKKSWLSTTPPNQNESVDPAMRTDVRKKATSA